MADETLRQSLRRVGPAFLSTRLALFAWAWWITAGLEGGRFRLLLDWPWLDGWVRWDSGWYFQITQAGYYLNSDSMSTAAFFPLYPVLSWVLSLPLRLLLPETRAVLVAGILLSHAGFWLGLAGLRQLMLARTDPASAGRCIWLVCCFPFSYFFGAYYTEGLFFALTVWAFRLFEAGQDANACGLAALSATCRAQGLFVGAGLALEMLRRRRNLSPLLLVAAAGLGIGIFYSQEVGNALAPVAAQKHFRGANAIAQLREIPQLGRVDLGVRLANFSCLLLSWVAIPLTGWRFGPGYALVAFLCVSVPAWSSLFSVGRYTLTVFPIFMLGGELLRHRGLFGIVVLLSLTGLAWMSQLFFSWGPAY